MRIGGITAAAVVGYLAGTFPTSDLVARRVSGGTVDLRATGSGNPGGANALAVLGAGAGTVVMVGDIGKGALACAVGGVVGGPTGAHVAGAAAVIGHCHPVWTGFRGGKGVAASVGQCLATFPAYFPIDLAVAAMTASNPRWKHRAFTATAISSICWVTCGVVWWVRGWPNLWGPRPSVALPLFAAVSGAVIASRFASANRGAEHAKVTS